jgi:ParB/Sulfiredoxin domain
MIYERGEMPSLPISQIKVRGRFRKELGDIKSLAESIEEVGLLHPIVVRRDGRLIAGERRLRACKQLGWDNVPVTVIDIDQIVRGEFAENAFRRDFLPSEVDAIRRALEPLERVAAKKRMSNGGKGVKISRSCRTLDRIGSFAGLSGRSIEKIRAIMDAADQALRTRHSEKPEESIIWCSALPMLRFWRFSPGKNDPVGLVGEMLLKDLTRNAGCGFSLEQSRRVGETLPPMVWSTKRRRCPYGRNHPL